MDLDAKGGGLDAGVGAPGLGDGDEKLAAGRFAFHRGVEGEQAAAEGQGAHGPEHAPDVGMGGDGGLGHARLGHKAGGGGPGEMALADALLSRQNPRMVHPRRSHRLAPFLPGVVMPRKHRVGRLHAGNIAKISAMIRAWIASASPCPSIRAKRSGSALAKCANASATRAW